MNYDLCNKFINNQTINPKTGRKIKKNGPTHKKLMKACHDMFVPGKKDTKLERTAVLVKKKVKKVKKVKKEKKQLTKEEECKKWKMNKTKNPKTNRNIKEYGPTYKKFQKMCGKDKVVKKNMRMIETSIVKIIDSYGQESPNYIIKNKTKRIKYAQKKLSAGSKVTEIIMILYLMKKHKDNLEIMARKDFKKLFKKININAYKLKYKDLKWQDYQIEIRIDENKNVKKIKTPYSDMYMKKFFNKIKNGSKRFGFILVGLFGKDMGHANFIVYDKMTNNAYRFEPHGASVSFYNTNDVDEKLNKKFIKYGVKYNSLANICPLGPQYFDVREEGAGSLDPGGFCSYWCIIFIDFILTNYNHKKYKYKTINQYLELMLYGIDKKFGSFKKYIRTFAVFINNVSNNIGENKDLDSYIDKMIEKI